MARTFPKRKLRQEYVRSLRSHGWSLVLPVLGVAVVATACWLLGTSGFETGLIVGVLATTFLFMTVIVFLQSGGGGLLGGKWAEDYTHEDLRWAQKQALIWGFANNVQFADGDIDHVVVAPAEAVAIETKWHFSGWSPARLGRDVAQARRMAGRLRSVLRSVDFKESTTVRAVLVVWGPGADPLPDRSEHDGVVVLPGRALRAELQAMRTGMLSEDQGNRILEKLRTFQRRVLAG